MHASEKILIAAERLFAERGFGVSLREIAVAGGQRNHSAVQYHFGGKAGLIDALYAYRMKPLNLRRRELIADLRAHGLDRDLPALVEAYVAPLAEHVLAHRGTSRYLRFTSRYVLSGGYRSWPYSGDHHPGVDELFGLFLERLPALTEERLRVLNLHIVTVLADIEQRLEEPGFDASQAAAALADLRTTALALLTAPAPPSSRGVSGGDRGTGVRPLSETQMSVIDAALAEELTDLLDLPPELLERYRAQVAGRPPGR